MSDKSLTPMLGTISKVVVAVLSLGLMVEKTSEIGKNMPTFDRFDLSSLFTTTMMLPHFWITLLSPICFLWALWEAGAVFDRLSAGQGFNEAVTKGLKSVGENLMYGAVAAILIEPSLLSWVLGDGRGLYFKMNIAPITIGLIGAMLWLLAAQGRKLKTELDSII